MASYIEPSLGDWARHNLKIKTQKCWGCSSVAKQPGFQSPKGEGSKTTDEQVWDGPNLAIPRCQIFTNHLLDGGAGEAPVTPGDPGLFSWRQRTLLFSAGAVFRSEF